MNASRYSRNKYVKKSSPFDTGSLCSGKSSKSAFKKVRGLTRAPSSALALNEWQLPESAQATSPCETHNWDNDLEITMDGLWPAPGCAVQNSIRLADRSTVFKEDARKFLFQNGAARQHTPEQACLDCRDQACARRSQSVSRRTEWAREKGTYGLALAAGLLSMTVQKCLTNNCIENGTTPLIQYFDLSQKEPDPEITAVADCGLLLSRMLITAQT